ncbi:hypothetical protein EMCG_01827 [[Emmonsia] crescens]|uniref:Uncharacterized protein n=1 Tax=[Emmonsia] crescens TaxID=73230 RepID=A0A0G2J282_9EURO|nr:hypothetical protein EMCG_01827 [Emmonsia crescens UAMH 3008]
MGVGRYSHSRDIKDVRLKIPSPPDALQEREGRGDRRDPSDPSDLSGPSDPNNSSDCSSDDDEVY